MTRMLYLAFRRDRHFDGRDDAGVAAATVSVQNAQVDQAGTRCDTFEHACASGATLAVGGDDSGDVLPMTILIVTVAAQEVVTVDNAFAGS